MFYIIITTTEHWQHPLTPKVRFCCDVTCSGHSDWGRNKVQSVLKSMSERGTAVCVASIISCLRHYRQKKDSQCWACASSIQIYGAIACYYNHDTWQIIWSSSWGKPWFLMCRVCNLSDLSLFPAVINKTTVSRKWDSEKALSYECWWIKALKCVWV